MVNRLEKSGIPHSQAYKKPERFKEKGLVITVKKNEKPSDKDEAEKEGKDVSTLNEKEDNSIKPLRDFTIINNTNINNITNSNDKKPHKKIEIEIFSKDLDNKNNRQNDEDEDSMDNEIIPLF